MQKIMGAYNDAPYSCNIEKLKETNIHSVFDLSTVKHVMICAVV